ncbi:three-Cys-motif partner protein TcmP [Rhizobium leguminosarum]|uniref:three-Cys-motif partner protein TcmP n=1 Tax=Rhizobium leguminosarum TaxID=384 RepID=UPI001C95958C|nr:three-Cys-motif partner protein TcmP [Rhizobium leguminosarum]MBY5608716.1 three-Cys-motif partner protein TcmP [Rhizobium leguminosarum]MBY5657290.1 three-Cys-motif partner protein TcmP [Rhizobium leguminosarum]
MKSTDDHEFGGQHTEIKLELVEKYLKAYSTALRQKFNSLWYIDAFAGTGSRTVRIEAKDGDLFDEPIPERVESRRGSAKIALDIEPKFDRLIFMDQKPAHCAALEALKASHPGRDVHVLNGDANVIIQNNINRVDWSSRRAIMFLDPYGMEVAWETLQAIAKTKAIDVWFLFPLSGLYRQAARNISGVDATKRKALTIMLGTDEWEAELYSPVPPIIDLLGTLEAPEERQRNADVAGLESYVKRRLETIFPLVADPFPLPPQKKPQRFSLFFAASNPSPKAIDLANRFARHIISAGISSHVRPR